MYVKKRYFPLCLLHLSFTTFKYFFQTLHSADLGDFYSVLHDNELNFGTADSVPAGAITYATDRQVTWYLMTSPHVPTDCDTDAACRVSLSTEGGFVVFDMQDVTPNERYFICVHSNASEVDREWYTETFEELSSCSNGFIFDTIAPQPRQVHVQNTNGFLTADQDVMVHWEEFKDNVDPTEFGYPSSIMDYYISCGKCVTKFNYTGFNRVLTFLIYICKFCT